MKRLVTILAIAAALAATLAPAAQAYQGSPDEQTVQGSILFPTRFTDGTSGWPGAVRKFYEVTGSAGNGIIGWVFQVDPATMGGYFTLSIDSQGPTNDADLDVAFYQDLGNALDSPISLNGYATHGAVETGFVPPQSTYGIIYMATGENVAFTYDALQPTGIELSEAGIAPSDVTVKAGAFVNFQNVGSDFHGATANDGSFSTGDAKHPIEPGESAFVEFLNTGDYAYTDPYTGAAGVIHVVSGPGPGTP